MPVVFQEVYYSPRVTERLATVLEKVLPGERELVFVCIGTDKNLLDCLGPLTGTMLVQGMPELKVYGTLDAPLHAQNLPRLLREIRKKHPQAAEVAIDASVGSREQLGVIKVREGSIIPGKAMARGLPEVGEVAVTGVVTSRPLGNKNGIFQDGTITPVYHMARTISDAILLWGQHR